MTSTLKDASAVLSGVERDFVVAAVHSRLRADGRQLLEMRRLALALHRGPDSSRAEVELGDTKAAAIVRAALVQPNADRPSEGMLRIRVDMSGIASQGFEGGRPHPRESELTRILERSLRESRAVDTEALCVLAGHAVWEVELDVRVLDHRGNLEDAAAAASIAALRHFRRPQTTIQGFVVTAVPLTEREGVPLSIHHTPVCMTFAIHRYGLLPDGAPSTSPHAPGVTSAARALVLDPTDREELVCDGRVTLVLNAHSELCGVHKVGGCPLTPGELMHCVRTAAVRAEELCGRIDEALKREDERTAAALYARPVSDAHAAALGRERVAVAGTFTAEARRDAGGATVEAGIDVAGR